LLTHKQRPQLIPFRKQLVTLAYRILITYIFVTLFRPIADTGQYNSEIEVSTCQQPWTYSPEATAVYRVWWRQL